MNKADRTDTQFRDVVISFDWVPSVGGAHQWLYEVYRRWGTWVKVLTTAAPNLGRAPRDDEGKLTVCDGALPILDVAAGSAQCWLRFWKNARLAARLAQQMRGEGKVRFHCVRAVPEGLVGLLACWLLRGRALLVVYAHGEDVAVYQTSRLLTLIGRLVYRKASRVITNSMNTRGLVLVLAPHVRVVCIHPGVDTREVRPDPAHTAEFRRQLGIPDQSLVVSTVARMEPRKNQPAVMRAVARLRAEGFDLVYVCVGDGPERATLEALIASQQWQTWALLPGQISDQQKALVYAISDLFVMPSVTAGPMFEGFGMVFLEAAAAGVPSISGNTGGQSEAVVHGKTGLVVDGTDDGAVEQAIRKLIVDGELRRFMGRQAWQWAQSHDWQKVVAHTMAEIESIQSDET